MVSHGAPRGAPKDAQLPAPFHGVHVAPPQTGCERLVWRKPTARCTHLRVRRHTCECQPVVYELCVSGGLVFVRRTVRKPAGLSVRETEWLLTARAMELWQRLLTGQAR
ncbi:hypothetical protein [Microbispora hainanensis]|uniref:Uncharacterized protein n=1 Tax=Microbispora hainanensis TaxID=568844 RepID=A0A544XRG4_9ACTN|nr:hypothetical protein [Microbispora hainanensis]TQS07092.1 hypothetical protein FLX08_39445 [Microbispora hainanensis]